MSATYPDLLKKITELRPKIESALKEGKYSGMAEYSLIYLAEIEKILQEGTSQKKYTNEERQNLLGGIGKTVLDDYYFSASQLGDEFFDIINEFRNIDD